MRFEGRPDVLCVADGEEKETRRVIFNPVTATVAARICWWEATATLFGFSKIGHANKSSTIDFLTSTREHVLKEMDLRMARTRRERTRLRQYSEARSTDDDAANEDEEKSVTRVEKAGTKEDAWMERFTNEVAPDEEEVAIVKRSSSSFAMDETSASEEGKHFETRKGIFLTRFAHCFGFSKRRLLCCEMMILES